MSEYYIIAICVSLFGARILALVTDADKDELKFLGISARFFSILGAVVFIVRWFNGVAQ